MPNKNISQKLRWNKDIFRQKILEEFITNQTILKKNTKESSSSRRNAVPDGSR